MLASDYHSAFQQLTEKLSCGVQLPAAWHDYFHHDGLQPPTVAESRQFMRRQFRERAVLELGTTLPACPREAQLIGIITKDFAKNSLGFLHSEQLFPGEMVVVWTSLGKYRLKVTRSRKVGDGCYEIGARRIETLS